MKYEHFKTVATDWSINRYYRLPDCRKFSVEWEYTKVKYDFNHLPYIYKKETTVVTQKAYYAVVTFRRIDNSFFNFDILDEEMVAIRGKHCKGIPMYIKIYNELVKGDY